MEDDQLYEKLKEFAEQAQHAREFIWDGNMLDADQKLDKLILNITNFSADRMNKESQCL